METVKPTTFTALDFETAQGKSYSICQVGLVRVDNGKVVHTFECLVKPPNNFYWNWFTEQNVVAHNVHFDARCLKETLEYYGLPVPEYTKYCTMKIFGGGLDANCEDYGIDLKHHDALSDAMGCAKLFLLHLEKGAPNNPDIKTNGHPWRPF
jgi:DNA polymerase-3 subunit epsilon